MALQSSSSLDPAYDLAHQMSGDDDRLVDLGCDCAHTRLSIFGFWRSPSMLGFLQNPCKTLFLAALNTRMFQKVKPSLPHCSGRLLEQRPCHGDCNRLDPAGWSLRLRTPLRPNRTTDAAMPEYGMQSIVTKEPVLHPPGNRLRT